MYTDALYKDIATLYKISDTHMNRTNLCLLNTSRLLNQILT